MKKKKIIIIGGGPAGMMAAIRAGNSFHEIILLEKHSSLGKKLLLTGNGRCNLTNIRNLATFIDAFGKNGPFLRDAFKEFFNTDLISFFKTRGLRCTEEQGGRIFPSKNNASGILEILRKEIIKNNVRIKYSSPAEAILIENNHITGVKLKKKDILYCDAVILASGGITYPVTGSTGDGYKMAKKLGHTVTALKAGLVPLILKDKYLSSLEGLSLKNISVIVFRGNRKIKTFRGDIIFTSHGISGPVILSSSGFISDLLDKKSQVHIGLDLFPDLTIEEVRSSLALHFSKSSSKTMLNSMKDLFPHRLNTLLFEIAVINKNRKSNQSMRKEISALASLCKKIMLQVCKTEHTDKGMITRGGISLKEINPRTMSSKLIKGLFFAGEIIDIAGDTGGFNLQEAFSSGYLAGGNIIQD